VIDILTKKLHLIEHHSRKLGHGVNPITSARLPVENPLGPGFGGFRVELSPSRVFVVDSSEGYVQNITETLLAQVLPGAGLTLPVDLTPAQPAGLTVTPLTAQALPPAYLPVPFQVSGTPLGSYEEVVVGTQGDQNEVSNTVTVEVIDGFCYVPIIPGANPDPFGPIGSPAAGGRGWVASLNSITVPVRAQYDVTVNTVVDDPGGPSDAQLGYSLNGAGFVYQTVSDGGPGMDLGLNAFWGPLDLLPGDVLTFSVILSGSMTFPPGMGALAYQVGFVGQAT